MLWQMADGAFGLRSHVRPKRTPVSVNLWRWCLMNIALVAKTSQQFSHAAEPSPAGMHRDDLFSSRRRLNRTK
jgi:hypothetical protein